MPVSSGSTLPTAQWSQDAKLSNPSAESYSLEPFKDTPESLPLQHAAAAPLLRLPGAAVISWRRSRVSASTRPLPLTLFPTQQPGWFL